MKRRTRSAGQMNTDLVMTSDRAPNHAPIRDRAEPGGLAARFALVISDVTAGCSS
jgi:hypothetical protein